LVPRESEPALCLSSLLMLTLTFFSPTRLPSRTHLGSPIDFGPQQPCLFCFSSAKCGFCLSLFLLLALIRGRSCFPPLYLGFLPFLFPLCYVFPAPGFQILTLRKTLSCTACSLVCVRLIPSPPLQFCRSAPPLQSSLVRPEIDLSRVLMTPNFRGLFGLCAHSFGSGADPPVIVSRGLNFAFYCSYLFPSFFFCVALPLPARKIKFAQSTAGFNSFRLVRRDTPPRSTVAFFLSRPPSYFHFS